MSLLSHATSGALSALIAWKIAATLPQLALQEDWLKFTLACTALVLVAAPTSVVPIISIALKRMKL